MTQAKDGKIKTMSGLSTRIYTKVGAQWKLVHGHFSPVAPPKN